MKISRTIKPVVTYATEIANLWTNIEILQIKK